MITFTIWGKPHTKGRPRFGNGRAYTDAATREAEAVTLHEFRKAGGQRIEHGPVEVRALYILPDHRRRDIDNLLKLSLDALNGHAFKDDSQIVRIEVEKRVGAEPRTEITILPAADKPGPLAEDTAAA